MVLELDIEFRETATEQSHPLLQNTEAQRFCFEVDIK